MTDKKITDEEIIKRLERCVKRGNRNYDTDIVLDLINRQKSEIERLGNALLALMNYLNIIGCDKSDVSFIKIATDLNKQIRADIKSQSVKDFVERLCEGKVSNDKTVIEAKVLLKEMVGEEE